MTHETVLSWWTTSQITRFMGPTWDPPGSCQPQMGPMLAPWTLLSGITGITHMVFLSLCFVFWSSTTNFTLSSMFTLLTLGQLCNTLMLGKHPDDYGYHASLDMTIKPHQIKEHQNHLYALWGMILDMVSASERQCYNVKSSLIGWSSLLKGHIVLW